MFKENAIFLVGIAAISIYFVINLFGLNSYFLSLFVPEIANATSVTVSASVAATITCTTDISTTSFGTLTSASISTASPDATNTMNCANSAAGCVMSVQDSGTSTGAISGLAAEPVGAIIESPNSAYSASTTLAAGTEGFGLLATTTAAGSGAALTIGARYNSTGQWDLNIIGGASTTAQTLATANSSTTGRQVKMRHKVAISASTPAGSYKDTITYQCAAN